MREHSVAGYANVALDMQALIQSAHPSVWELIKCETMECVKLGSDILVTKLLNTDSALKHFFNID